MTRRSALSIFIFSLLVSGVLIGATPQASAADDPPVAGHRIMTSDQAIVLGVVEGLTEYLPVSSTGHLLLTEKVMGLGDGAKLSPAQHARVTEALDAYTICIQGGAILAVLWLYFGRIKQILLGMVGRDPDGLRLLISVAAGFLPAAVLGLLFNKAIKSHLFGPWPVVVAWFVGGLAILVVSWRNRSRDRSGRAVLPLGELTWLMALAIGFAQCIAMWPGVSRSLVTIVAGLLVGLSMEAAVEYSFLLGVVTLGAATSYDALKHGQLMLQTFDHMSLLIGVAVAFVAAVVSVKWMVSYLSLHGLELFGYYRVTLAAGTTFFLFMTSATWG